MTVALESDLIGLGVPPAVATLIGETIPAPVAGTGTAQSGARALAGTINQVTTAAGDTAFILPANRAVGTTVYVYNASSTAALVFPPTGGSINELSANASFSVAQGRSTGFTRVSSTKWIVQYGA